MTNDTKNAPPRNVIFLKLLFASFLLAILVAVIGPNNYHQHQKTDLVRATSNAKGIKSALDLFASDFEGAYPNDETAKELLKLRKFGTSSSPTKTLSPPTTSNYYFNQLMGRGLDNEEIFFQKSHKKTFRLRKPNNDGIIDQGENVWGYTKNLKQTSSSHLPLIYDSPVSMGDSPAYSKKTWNGRIVIARLDGSTRTEKITGPDPRVGTITKKINGRQINIFSPKALEGRVCLPADLKRIGSDN